MKFRFCACVILLLCALSLTLTGCWQTPTPSPRPSVSIPSPSISSSTPAPSVATTTPTAPTQPVVDRFPNLSDRYDDHVLLQCKNTGACKTMTGDVLLVMIMVSDDGASWTPEDMATYKQQQLDATYKLGSEAEQHGVALNLSFLYLECSISGSVTMENFGDWTQKALDALGWPARDEVTPWLKDVYGVKEAPVFFCVNYPGRSFGIEWNQGEYFEYAILYSEHADYRHELNHLFGAADFYAPHVICEAAMGHFPYSIMITGGNHVYTDDLTAYLIGWTDQPSPTMLAFLDETAWVTQEYIQAHPNEDAYTGYATVWWGDGIYTGDLLGGVPNGNGSIRWLNGNTYEGQWKDGALHGYGTYVWYAENATYTGNWVNYTMHGYGEYIDANGNRFAGQWDNGTYIG